MQFLDKLYLTLEDIRTNINKNFDVTEEDKKIAETNNSYKILNWLKKNKTLVGTIIILIMIWFYYTYVINYSTCDTQVNKIINIQSGGNPLKGISGLGSGFKKGAKAETGKSPYASKLSKRDMALRKGTYKSVGKAAGKGTVKGVRKAAAGTQQGAKKAAAYASKKADQFKVLSGDIYKVLFQLALTVMMFLVFGPTLALAGVMIICGAVLRKKLLSLKEL